MKYKGILKIIFIIETLRVETVEFNELHALLLS